MMSFATTAFLALAAEASFRFLGENRVLVDEGDVRFFVLCFLRMLLPSGDPNACVWAGRLRATYTVPS